MLAAAVLHDTVEDAGVSLEQLRQAFGERVARLVALETEDKCRGVAPELSWRGRKEQTVARLQGGLDRGRRRWCWGTSCPTCVPFTGAS